MVADQFASLRAASGVPKVHPTPCLLTQLARPISDTANKKLDMVWRVWLFALSGLYSRVLDGQIVCQIRCLVLKMYPCSAGALYSREPATFRSVKIQFVIQSGLCSAGNMSKREQLKINFCLARRVHSATLSSPSNVLCLWKSFILNAFISSFGHNWKKLIGVFREDVVS